MLRKSAFLILGLICLFSVQLGFAATQPVTADQIIIAETLNEKMTNDKLVYIDVNIANAKIAEHPIYVSLIRVENNIQFADALGSDLKISVMKLSSSSVGDVDRATLYSTKLSVSTPVYSDGYKKETQVINRFFELKDLISNQVTEMTALNKKYRFDLIVGNPDEIAKLDTATYDLFKRWSQLKTSTAELRKEFNQVQVHYASYFEKSLVQDVIDKIPTYSKELGKLPVGEYKLRFLDEDKLLIKEFTFSIVDKTVETIKPIETFSIK